VNVKFGHLEYDFRLLRKDLVLVEASSQYAITSMFLRPQEFYESPYPSIHAQYFELDEYIDIYARDKGKFSYYTDWSGFNIPSTSFKKFIEVFQYSFSAKEHILVNGIRSLIPNLDEARFYIISVIKNNVDRSTLNHEIAHALWYLDENYCVKMQILVDDIPTKVHTPIVRRLRKCGYAEKVMDDEIQAYLATSPSIKIRSLFHLPKSYKIPCGFKKTFLEYCGSNK